MKIDRH
ncbi:hypothetical protein LINPERPRIM_LOCUS31106 [Linum perenne]